MLPSSNARLVPRQHMAPTEGADVVCRSRDQGADAAGAAQRVVGFDPHHPVGGRAVEGELPRRGKVAVGRHLEHLVGEAAGDAPRTVGRAGIDDDDLIDGADQAAETRFKGWSVVPGNKGGGDGHKCLRWSSGLECRPPAAALRIADGCG
jgi:hypothetical protein